MKCYTCKNLFFQRLEDDRGKNIDKFKCLISGDTIRLDFDTMECNYYKYKLRKKLWLK